MKTLGIIAEYNPFHKGHLYHLQKSKEMTGADVTVAVMSGNFTQRGEPAILDKWKRAETAINNGVDLVIELPFVFACNNAEYFAKGAIDIFNGLGCVDYLSFGSEEGNLDVLSKVASVIADESKEFKELLKKQLDNGISYPKARANVITKITGVEDNVLKSSNNILAIEYLKQLQRSHSNIKPITIKRAGENYNSTEIKKIYPSATAIRQNWGSLLENPWLYEALPEGTISVLKEINIINKVELNDFYRLIMTSVLKADSDEIADIFAATEGIENRIKREIRNCDTIETLVEKTVSKRYTRTRINRILVQQLIGLKKACFNEIIEENLVYGRILGFSNKGAELIRHIKKSKCSGIKMLTNINKDIESDSQLLKLLKYDILASDFYNLAAGHSLYKFSDYTVKPFIIKK